MQEFFKKMFYGGLKILLFIFIIWIIYFTINYFSPHAFDAFRTQKKDTTFTSTVEKKSFGYKMYDLFFKSKKSTNQNATSTENLTKKSLWNSDGESSVWGKSSSSTWGDGIENNTWGGGKSYDRLSFKSGIFVSANIKKSPVQNMSINNLLINAYSKNILVDGAIINGSVFSNYQSQYYFNINVYDKQGNFLFLIPFSSAKDLRNEDYSTFYGVYNKNFNYQNYIGEGYMAIFPDDPNIDGIVLIKINIK